MNVLLVSTNMCGVPFFVYPLGVSVAANILKEKGHNVEIFDMLVENGSYEKLIHKINIIKPDIIGMSFRNSYIDTVPVCERITDIAHEFGIKTFAAGSALLYDYKRIIKNTNVDFVLFGPAEGNLLEFIDKIENDCYIGDRLVKSKICNYVSDILYDEKLLNFYSKIPYSIGVNTKKGCNYNCLYCMYSKLEAHSNAFRKNKNIIDSLKILKNKYNIDSFFFTDGILNDSNRYTKLLNFMNYENINMKWAAYLGPVTEEKDLKLMVESGLEYPFFGVDASTDKTLKAMNKNFLWDTVIKCDKLLLKYKIKKSVASFIFGGPSETKESILEGIENIKKLHFSIFEINIFNDFSGTIINDSNKKFFNNFDSKWLEEKLKDEFGQLGYIKNCYI